MLGGFLWSPLAFALDCAPPLSLTEMARKCENIVVGEVEAFEEGKEKKDSFYRIKILKVLKESGPPLTISDQSRYFRFAFSNLWGDTLNLKAGQIALFCVKKSVLYLEQERVPLHCNIPLLIK